jgi:steroid 5-alpha reductase family enzyme
MTILLLFCLLVAMSLFMTGAWLIERQTGQSGWIDTIWSFSTGIVGVAGALIVVGDESLSLRNFVVAGMVAIWSFRLGSHIARRTLKSGGVDPRYSNLKKEWGDSAAMRLFLFLQSQAIAGFILVLAVYMAAHNPAPFPNIADCIGIIIFAVAVLGEALADRQMREFGVDPANKDKVCDVGLWSISRHPNYFFEWLGWVAYPIIAISFTQGHFMGWLAILAPIQMYYLLVHVSGIPPLEAHMLKSRGDKFRDYQRRVSAFWPIPKAVK